MKKITLKKIGILCVSMLFAAVSAGGAVSAEEPPAKQTRDGYACEKCYIGFVDYVCQGTPVERDTGTHKYGLFGSKTCTVTYNYCYSDYACLQCGEVYEEDYGPHLCWEEHEDCGRGHYNLCPCGNWPD